MFCILYFILIRRILYFGRIKIFQFTAHKKKEIITILFIGTWIFLRRINANVIQSLSF